MPPLPTLLPGLPRRLRLLTLAFLAVLVLDLASKWYALRYLPAVPDPDWPNLHLLPLLGFASMLGLLLPSPLAALGVGAALGGAAGNLTSLAVWRGAPNFVPLPGGWLCNFADLEIDAGAILLVLAAALLVAEIVAQLCCRFALGRG